MTRPTYLADEVRARLAEYEALRARCAALEGALRDLEMAASLQIRQGFNYAALEFAVKCARSVLSSPATGDKEGAR